MWTLSPWSSTFINSTVFSNNELISNINPSQRIHMVVLHAFHLRNTCWVGWASPSSGMMTDNTSWCGNCHIRDWLWFTTTLNTILTSSSSEIINLPIQLLEHSYWPIFLLLSNMLPVLTQQTWYYQASNSIGLGKEWIHHIDRPYLCMHFQQRNDSKRDADWWDFIFPGFSRNRIII